MKSPKIVRIYTDAFGKSRKITLSERFSHAVRWNRDLPPCLASKWLLEDGSTVQIPEASWEFYGIKYRDFEE